jgi:hypothetical protein
MTSHPVKIQSIRKQGIKNLTPKQNNCRGTDSRLRLVKLGESISSRYQEEDLKMLIQILKDMTYQKQVERKGTLLDQKAHPLRDQPELANESVEP